MVKLSICIPVYNGERFLAKTIESILTQTYRDFELIIVDNASTDKTAELVKKIKDPRLRYFRNDTTISPPMNWNRCLELAGGEYVALYHADDVYHKDIVQKEVDCLDGDPRVGAVFSLANLINDKDEKIGSIGIPKNLKGKNALDLKGLLVNLIRNNRNPLVCPSCMARNSLYQELKFFETKSYKFVFDLDMYLRMAEKMDLAIIEEPLINYRVHPGQGTEKHASGKEDHNEVYDMYDKFISRHPELLTKSDLNCYDCLKHWDYVVQAMKAYARKDSAMGKTLLGKWFSRNILFTSFTDLNLFLRMCISSAFFIIASIGLGSVAAPYILKQKRMIGYAI